MAFTVADYILKRLSEQGVDTLFGVPAAYCTPLFDAATRHGITPVVTTSDLEAGYAADGYARTKGLGAVSVAYGVGTLSMMNTVAGGYVPRPRHQWRPGRCRPRQSASVRCAVLTLDRTGCH